MSQISDPGSNTAERQYERPVLHGAQFSVSTAAEREHVDQLVVMVRMLGGPRSPDWLRVPFARDRASGTDACRFATSRIVSADFAELVRQKAGGLVPHRLQYDSKRRIALPVGSVPSGGKSLLQGGWP
jgi:hypothetical protein